MKLHLLDAITGLWANWKGNTDGSAHVALTKVGTVAVAAGPAAKAAAIPVTMATDQPAQDSNITKVAGAALALGAAAKAAAIPVTMATDQPPLGVKAPGDYETVAASQADQVLGATGAAGDYLDQLLLIPANANPGAVSIKDGAGAAITVFAGGAASVAVLDAIPVPIHATSAAGAWKVTTGADVSVIATGKFTA
ncbi:MAG: hypothetical protein PHU07_13610 [Acidocella sp.]|nr:hypothetical protein [Acidocella sp.]